MKELFLDSNAHLPVSPRALKAYADFSISAAGHGHPLSPSVAGLAAASAIEKARERIGELIGAADESTIIFTSSCTQACEWAIQILHKISYGATVISPTEHTAVYDAFEQIFGAELYFKHDNNGVFNSDKYEPNDIVADRVVCIHLQNEIGIIQPLDKIRKNYLFSDMSQSLGKIPVNVSEQNVDIAVFGAHKFGGPGGVGFMYLRDTEWWQPFGTGSRYELDRSGTPDTAGVVATAEALQEAISTLPERTVKMEEFRSVLEPELKNLGFDIIADTAIRCPNTSFIRVGAGKSLEVMFKLGKEGIHVGLGSACGSLHTGASKLMKRLGLPGDADDFIRISQWGEYGREEALRVISALKK